MYLLSTTCVANHATYLHPQAAKAIIEDANGLIIHLDLQMVNITLRVLSRPDIKSLPWIHQRLGTDYDERVLPSIVNEVLKSVVVVLWFMLH